MKNVLRVSVIVASHRPDMVGVLLSSLQKQRIGRDVFEVIVVADYPGGSLPKESAGFRWIYLADKSISKKRNAGADVSRGVYLAFIDDDCIAAPDWVEKGVAYLDAHPETTAVEGATVIANYAHGFFPAIREYRRLEKPGLRTNNLFFRAAHFRAIGGFDERFTLQREDVDLAFTALKQGYRIDYCSDIRVTHRLRYGEKWDLIKNCWNRRFDPLLYRKHPRQYLKTVGSPLPPSQAAVFLLHICVLIASGKRRKAAAAAFVVIDTLAVALLGLRRCGLRVFSPLIWARESIQIFAAPFVVIAALIRGLFHLGTRRG